jgi:hypothetical protein
MRIDAVLDSEARRAPPGLRRPLTIIKGGCYRNGSNLSPVPARNPAAGRGGTASFSSGFTSAVSSAMVCLVRLGHPRSRVDPSASQRPYLLFSAAALPHAPGSPRLEVLRRLRPARALRQAPTYPLVPAWPDGRAERTQAVPTFTAIRLTG